ncbi:RNA polymerase sigma-70 factor [Gaoshiqia sediminis]|uniref:RNA polymerase sigma-70 factor n=1 Tax=Gaoshiqia sediminis TaxID=2986998 RepID=A0AA41Y4U9_9BACT|nr:RNA polymerase sigma-70 factor [Gaoshiqia sediminis]MCW0483486.1 RNA polymerase sigma-70 factor [Gaoshiqia sediminis]
MNNQTDKELFAQLKTGYEPAFKQLFLKYYAPLCYYARQYFDEDEKAEEVVQDVFVRIWAMRTKLDIEISVRQYFFRAVKNQCINQLQHQHIEQKYAHTVQEDFKNDRDTNPYFMEVGLQQKIETCIEALPEKRREIFRLSREEGLKYKEIADRLNISVKTVETQMGLALKQLREQLKDYRDYLIGWMLFFTKKTKTIQGEPSGKLS